MPTLLFEIGCEELPASACREAEEQLPALCLEHLGAEPAQLYIGPRRLAVLVEDVSGEAAPEWVKGPPVALREKAAAGFAKRYGVTADELEERDGFLGVEVPGKPLAERLAAILDALAFSKSMQWEAGGLRFARPVRWLCARLDEAVVLGDGTSYGHRFTSGRIEIPSAAGLRRDAARARRRARRGRAPAADPRGAARRLARSAREARGGRPPRREPGRAGGRVRRALPRAAAAGDRDGDAGPPALLPARPAPASPSSPTAATRRS